MSVEIAFRVVREWDLVKVKRTKEGEERVARLRGGEVEKCLACELPKAEGERFVCGTCPRCDQTQRYAMRKDIVTQNELIRCGERLAPFEQSGAGNGPKTDYAAKLLGRKKRESKTKSA